MSKEVELSDACDYGHQAESVRLDTGGHSGVYLCIAHWRTEMLWRQERNKTLSDSAKFDILAWPLLGKGR